MYLNQKGLIAREEWMKTPQLRPGVEVDCQAFIIMPNHVHGIIDIVDAETPPVRAYSYTPLPQTLEGNNLRSPSKILGSIIRGYKASVTTRINTLQNSPGRRVWLRNYYEHIICSDEEYDTIAAYIQANPQNWEISDDYFISYGKI